MAVTRFGLEGYGVRRAGSFADKTTAALLVLTPVPELTLRRAAQRARSLRRALTRQRRLSGA